MAGVLSTFAKEMRKYLCHRGEIELKREMVDRGMGSQEIEQVVRASKSDSLPPKFAQHVR